MTRYNIIVRLAQLRKKQCDVLVELHNRGIIVAASQLSRYINGRENPPKSEIVLEAADKIITEWEAEQCQNS